MTLLNIRDLMLYVPPGTLYTKYLSIDLFLSFVAICLDVTTSESENETILREGNTVGILQSHINL